MTLFPHSKTIQHNKIYTSYISSIYKLQLFPHLKHMVKESWSVTLVSHLLYRNMYVKVGKSLFVNKCCYSMENHVV